MGRDESLSLSCECKEDAIAYTVNIVSVIQYITNT